MRIAIGSDHRGRAVRPQVVEFVQSLGHEAIEISADDEGPSDYPDIAMIVARMVGSGEVDRGILICGTGIGMSVAANKVLGVRAAPCHDDLTAEMSRRHNDLNLLCFSADLLGRRMIERIVSIWINSPFEGGKHQRRIDQISQIEREVYQND